MVASTIVEPVMHTDKDDPIGVEKQGFRVINTGMFAYSSDFVNIPILKTVFEPKVQLLHTLNDTCKGNSNLIQQRNDQAKIVYVDLGILLMYAKPICKGDVVLTQKSGFDSNIIPSAHPLAPQAVIKKIVKGPGFKTIKVMLVKASGDELQKRESRTYIVYVFDKEDGEPIKIGCVNNDSRKLFIENVPSMTQLWYAVAIKNAAGINELSGKVRYTLTD
jgi:hypothetical protein